MAEYDAQLHVLRTAARAVGDPRHRHELETARFKLFAALESGDDAEALALLEALEVGFDAATAGADQDPQRLTLRATTWASIERAVTIIRDGLT